MTDFRASLSQILWTVGVSALGCIALACVPGGLGVAGGTGMAIAADAPPPSPEQLDFFEKKIRPVLAEQCFKCHSATAEKVKGGLLLDTKAALFKGGDNGPAVKLGDPDKSLIITAIRYTDEDMQMPPKHRLEPQVVESFEEWVKMGAPDPMEGRETGGPARLTLADASNFWSLQPVAKPAPPTVKDTDWAWNEVDRFLLAKLEAKGLKPNADLDKRGLLRRVTYDLIGLPPTIEEMDAFLVDQSPEAFAKVVDRLLASPRYGEQWGRHWLDVARYADTSGCNSDYPIPAAYRYRDYVIDSFNRDKPYDEFVREQIAGDLLPAQSDQDHFDKIVATGYLAISRRFGSRNDEFHLTIDDTIDNLGKSVLGLSLGCARCHDHKFDPILAKDYYALYGIFASTKYAFPGTEIYRHTKDFVLLAPKAEAEEFAKEATELADLDDKIEHLKNAKAGAEREQITREALPPTDPASPRFIGPPAPDAKPRKTPEEVQAEIRAVVSRQKELESSQGRLEKAYAVSEGQPQNAKIQKKGDPSTLGDEAPRAFLTALGGQTLPPEEKGSGRAELAKWLTDPANPLTARVMANRIWQNHFGRGIVKTSNDFGFRGERPTHPELLDWLAARFVENGWSVKALHRIMLLSHAYRMSSEDDPEKAALDANNDLFWRHNRERLSAEELRDSLLFVSGELDLSHSGPHPFPPESKWNYTQHNPFVADYPTNRRAVYLMQQRIRKQPFLDVFDGADTNATTGVRPLSTTPIQALFFMNNRLAHEQASMLAARAEAAGSDETQQLALAYRLVYGRPPAPDEVEDGKAYLAQMREALESTEIPVSERPHAAMASLARVLLSTNEFLFIE